MIRTRIRTRLTAVLGTTAMVGTTALMATPAQAEEIPADYNIRKDVTGSATLAKRGMELNLPPGSKLHSRLNPDFTLSSRLVTPPSTVKMRIFDVPKIGDVTANVKIQGTQDSAGVLGANNSITVTNKFKITIPRISSDALPKVNIVKSTCSSGEITAELSGTYTDLLGAPFDVSGDFDIPAFKGCGFSLFGLPAARDLLLTEMLSGPDNTLNLTVSPEATP